MIFHVSQGGRKYLGLKGFGVLPIFFREKSNRLLSHFRKCEEENMWEKRFLFSCFRLSRALIIFQLLLPAAHLFWVMEEAQEFEVGWEAIDYITGFLHAVQMGVQDLSLLPQPPQPKQRDLGTLEQMVGNGLLDGRGWNLSPELLSKHTLSFSVCLNDCHFRHPLYCLEGLEAEVGT